MLKMLYFGVHLFFSGGSKEMSCHGDMYEFKRDCGVSSVMVARAAEWNPSVFRKEGKLDVHDVIKEYLKYVRYLQVLFSI